MKESRRLFVVVLLIALIYLWLFPAESRAEYVSVKELGSQAETGWRETYEAYGRTIAVDIPVTLPKVNAFPVLRVKKISAVTVNLLDDFSAYINEEGYLSFDVT